MSERPKCVRIEMEYDDGSLYRATGEDAQKIKASIDSAFVMEAIHGAEYRGPQMQKVERRP